MREIHLYQWDDRLIWCPSQCYYYFKDKEGNIKCIYLRWRHNDPWTAEIVPLNEKFEFDFNAPWENLNPPFFKDSELDMLKEWCLKLSKVKDIINEDFFQQILACESIEQVIDLTYGKRGTPSREAFEKECEEWLKEKKAKK